MFVTNSLSFLPQCDMIIMLENGCIVETGSYDVLKDQNGVFTDFIRTYLESKEWKSDIENEDEEISPESSKKVLTKQISVVSSKLESKVDKEEKPGEKIIQKERIESGTVYIYFSFAYYKG
jgi:hypothetical protein